MSRFFFYEGRDLVGGAFVWLRDVEMGGKKK